MAEIELVEVVRRLAVVFARRQVRHALIGGLAVGLRSRPRATNDADFIVHVPARAFPGLLEELVGAGFEIDVMAVVRRWSVEHFTDFWCGRVRVDWMQPVLPIYATVLNGAELKPWLDAGIRVATAEGLILTKMLSFRPQDQVDIETLLIANRDEIDIGLIRREWSAVAEGEEARTAWLEDAIVRLIPPSNASAQSK
jgi:hypothetical protein